jgi:hypothetical protein
MREVIKRYRLVLSALAIAVLAAGCRVGDESLAVYATDGAGVVASLAPAGHDQSTTYSLENGQALDVDSRNWISGFSARPGDLLLVGSSPEPWAYAAINQGVGSDPCFTVTGATFDRGQSVDIRIMANAQNVYLRVAKSSAWTANLPFGVCLDTAGHARPIPRLTCETSKPDLNEPYESPCL